MRMDEATIETIRAALAAECPKLPVRLVVLFGSQLDGRARPDSDVDIGVWCDGETDYPVSAIIRAVEPIVGGREVDCVPLGFDEPSFSLNVAQSCEPLYYRAEGAFIDFLLIAHREYDDALEWRRADRDWVHNWALEYASWIT